MNQKHQLSCRWRARRNRSGRIHKPRLQRWFQRCAGRSMRLAARVADEMAAGPPGPQPQTSSRQPLAMGSSSASLSDMQISSGPPEV